MVREVKINRTMTRQKDGSEQEHEVREIRVWDKLAALALLARMHPEFSEKREHSGPGGGPIPLLAGVVNLSERQLVRIIEAAKERANG